MWLPELQLCLMHRCKRAMSLQPFLQLSSEETGFSSVPRISMLSHFLSFPIAVLPPACTVPPSLCWWLCSAKQKCCEFRRCISHICFFFSLQPASSALLSSLLFFIFSSVFFHLKHPQTLYLSITLLTLSLVRILKKKNAHTICLTTSLSHPLHRRTYHFFCPLSLSFC